MNFLLQADKRSKADLNASTALDLLSGASADIPVSTSSHSGLIATWAHGFPTLAPVTSGRTRQFMLKRTVDVALAGAAVLVLAPLLLTTAVAIKVSSPGPILFRQKREGLNGKLFEIFKFRSMRADAGDITGVAQTVVGDTRVTPLGAFLRKTSIDELPQLFNVLRGDMSLVGPRPHVPGMMAAGRVYCELVPYYSYRFNVAPGLTGWAQANGYRGPTDDAKRAIARVEHDVAYVQNFSIWLDAKIILKTVINEFLTGSAH